MDAILRLEQSPACLVFLHAEWCGHCKRFKPVMMSLAAKYDRVPVYAVNSETIEKYRESKHKDSVVLLAKGFPTTVMSVYGNAKHMRVGELPGDQADALFQVRTVQLLVSAAN